MSLLALGMLGCVAGSFGFSAIAGERVLAPNLVPAAILVSIPATLGLLALFAGLASTVTLYLAQTAWVFVGIAAIAGVMGVALSAATMVDATYITDPYPADSTAPRPVPRWRRRASAASLHVVAMIIIDACATVGVLVFRVQEGWAAPAEWLLATLVLATATTMFLSTAGAIARTAHEGSMRAPLRLGEAYAYCGVLAIFSLALIAAIPPIR